MAFKHKDFLEKLAKRSEISDTPWDDFQERQLGGDWVDLESFPIIKDDSEYRRKSSAFNVGGFEFDEPIDYQLPDGTVYYTPNPLRDRLFEEWKVGQYKMIEQINFDRKIVHLTSESAVNHAKAMLTLTKKKKKPVVVPDGTPSPTEA